MNNIPKAQSGFTLVELVMVIILLGILAVTAAPKFIDLSREARIAALQQLAAAMKQGADNSFIKATLQGCVDESCDKVTIDGQIFEVKKGYPEAHSDTAGRGDILEMINITAAPSTTQTLDSAGEWYICYGSSETGGPSGSCNGVNSSHVRVGYDTSRTNGCYVRYVETGGSATTIPKIVQDQEKYQIITDYSGC